MRVQVKSTSHQYLDGHACQVRGSQHRAYVDNSFDFVAVYLIPVDTWYIIPTERIAGQISLFFSARSKNGKYAQYKEAWHLLRTKPEYEGILESVQACAA
jgi:hypothetical protein